MESIYIAFIGLLGVFIGAGISAFVTWKLGKQSQKMEMRKLKAEFLMFNLRNMTDAYHLLEECIRVSDYTQLNMSSLIMMYDKYNMYITKSEKKDDLDKKIQEVRNYKPRKKNDEFNNSLEVMSLYQELKELLDLSSKRVAEELQVLIN